MTLRFCAAATLATVMLTLTGCGALRPGSIAVGASSRKAASKAIAARNITDAAKQPETSPEFRLPLTEEGFQLLRANFNWQAQPQRLDFYYDAWDGNDFRRAHDANAPKLRVKATADKVVWQLSQVVQQRQVPDVGLPVQMTIIRSQEGKLDEAAAVHLRKRTDEFYLWLDEGGEGLRQRAREVATFWQSTAWPGADVFFPVGNQPNTEQPAIYPSAAKVRHGWKVEIPKEQVGGGLRLFLHFDEVRDTTGQWIDAFEVEAEPIAPLQAGHEVPAAVDFGRALAVVGLTKGDVGEATRADATRYTRQQLQKP